MRMTLARTGQAEGNQTILTAIFTPRIWKIMIVGAYPFLISTARYFEALERKGSWEALIADTLMPATLIGYCVLLFVLKKHRL